MGSCNNIKIENLMHETIHIWLNFFLGLWMQHGDYLVGEGLGSLTTWKQKQKILESHCCWWENKLFNIYKIYWIHKVSIICIKSCIKILLNNNHINRTILSVLYAYFTKVTLNGKYWKHKGCCFLFMRCSICSCLPYFMYRHKA